MEAGRMGVPRMVSAAAVKQSNKAAATIVNLNCIVSILRSGPSSLKQHSVIPSEARDLGSDLEAKHATSHIRRSYCSARGSTFPPLMIATLTVVLGNSSSRNK